MPNQSEGVEIFHPLNEVVVFSVPEPGTCWYCNKATNLLAGPDHAPRDGGAHYTCEAHIDPEAVVQHAHGWPFEGLGVKLWRKCACCGASTANHVYCSTTCRKNALYPDWEARRAEIIRRRNEGEQFKVIAKDLGISAARASAVYRAAVTNATTR